MLNQPNIRFPDYYSHEIRFVKCDELFKKIRNGFVGTATPFYVESGIPYLQSNNIKNNKIIKTKIVYINEEFHKNNKKSILQKNDILMVQSGHAGECAVVNEEFHGTNCHALIVMTPNKNVNTDYCSSYINSPAGQKRLYRLITGNTIRHILASEIKEYKIPLISEEEQQKIASFFSLLDQKIEKQQGKIEQLELFKMGMMQKIFSQEIRFKYDDGGEFPEWEQKKLGDIAEVVMGQSPGGENYSTDSTNTVLIQGNADMLNGRVVPRFYTSEITKTCEPGDIILSVRAPVGTLALSNIKACIGRGVCAIKSNDFIYHFLVYFNKISGWSRLSQGSTFESINGNDIKSLLIKVPSTEEQEKISTFLNLNDLKLDKEKGKLEALQQQKKGFLQQMFV